MKRGLAAIKVAYHSPPVCLYNVWCLTEHLIPGPSGYASDLSWKVSFLWQQHTVSMAASPVGGGAVGGGLQRVSSQTSIRLLSLAGHKRARSTCGHTVIPHVNGSARIPPYGLRFFSLSTWEKWGAPNSHYTQPIALWAVPVFLCLCMFPTL